MDRFIVRESRSVYPGSGGPQMPQFPQPPSQNAPVSYIFEGNFSRETPNHYQGSVMNPYMLHHSPSFPPSGIHGNLQHQHVVSGIDPTYLSGYANNTFIAPGEHMNNNMSPYINHGYQYQSHNRNNLGTERNFNQQRTEELRQGFSTRNISNANQNTTPNNNTYIYSNPNISTINSQQKSWGAKDDSTRPMVSAEPKKTPLKDNTEKITNNNNITMVSRADKLKAVQKTGSRTFSGPIEKVLKWHKALQEVGLLVFYEIVAKCVSVRQGESCSKHLVIRDDSGPAMQVVYYEVDFLLPELKTPCTVRVIGKMMAGTSRFQAFNIRSASGDDVAMIPRRAAVSAHHVAKICKEFQCAA